jgi:hypothetical protein
LRSQDKYTLEELSLAIKSCVDFGEKEIRKELIERQKGDVTIFVAILMFRKYLEVLDSTSVLVADSCIDPIKIFSRGLIDLYFQICYLFEKESENRAKAFLVTNSKLELIQIDKFISDTAAGEYFRKPSNETKSFLIYFCRTVCISRVNLKKQPID